MKKFLQKAGVIVFIIIGITFISFALIYLSPSDPATMILEANGMHADEDAVIALKQQLGLDKPFPVQYLSWLNGLFHGNLGTSYRMKEPVTSILLNALPNTLTVAFGAMALTLLIAIPVGTMCAVTKDSIFDTIIKYITFLFASFPSFFLALLLLYLLGMKAGIFPVIGTTSGLGMIMPILTLAFCNCAWYIRQIRTIVLGELNKEYIRGLRSRGVTNSKILFYHVLKNSMIPIVTMVGISFGSMLGGTVIVESIFTWPGIGKIAVDAISQRDYPLIQGFVVWVSLMYFAINGGLEYLYVLLDPRIKRKKRPPDQ